MGFQKLSAYELSISKNLISSYEYILLPVYIFLFFVATRILVELIYKDQTIQKTIYKGLSLKIFGGLFVTLIFNFYYQGGDIGTYYNEGRILTNLILENPEYFFRIYFYSPSGDDTELKNLFTGMNYMNAADTRIILKITSFLNFFTFNSYLVTTFLYSYISFWCIWKLVYLLFTIYPDHKKFITWGFFFAPSLIVWGSAILKDTICFSSLCLIHYYLYQVFINNKFKPTYVIYILLTGYIILTIKLYILLAYAPCFSFMVTQQYKKNIQNVFLRALIAPFIIVFSLVISYVLVTQLGAQKERFSSEKIMQTAKIQRDYLHSVSLRSQGSTYDLGEMDDNLMSYVLKLPAGINVSLFRPYLWESRNPIMFLSAIESSFVLFITIRLFYKRRLKNTLTVLSKDINLQFFLLFGLLFSFLVGVTTYNFGSLVRYKIQGYPFYIVGILLLYYLQEPNDKKKFKKRKVFSADN
ncbi:hypothetical protein [Cytophaga hutchinsonii]|uniref:Glycosyltransferase RgtA/B/C/D-like domain-containing protein n=1 Tax=Cytophaga hutchinsonii (strain ATCC 33406 / DSM 1761 / CIP 103989 / NBRC 15051 / NCIMB 9469 / D465) TaxID=269798 RepID=A0A6N4SM72_CYTH3|nr:hypothetical protein [Cytophaga hutchinsonii]ABG57358.1 hypothetical protein CHU_0064 [Cytophaga hutchinsonii ATCC 33406]SFX47046.1 hypothetical protein SAMN04487930_104258 [Cytophaga hutchinsonii ATCC 33406]